MTATICNPALPPYTNGNKPFVVYTADGSTANFAVTFPFLGQTDYIANNGTATKSSFILVYTKVGDADWTQVSSGITMPDADTVRFSVNPTSGTKVLIRRWSQPENILVSYSAGSPVTTGTDDLKTSSNIGLDSLQIHYILQELWAAILDGDCRAVSSMLFTGNVYRWTADGSTYNFSMNNASSQMTPVTAELGILPGQVLVWIDGVHQQTDQFTVADSGGVSQVQFVHDVNHAAPFNGAIIEAQIIAGTVVPDVNIADGSVTCAKIGAGAICSLDKFGLDALATNKQVMTFFNPGTGVTLSIKTLDHSWISDFDTQVRTSRLDQMALPTSNLNLNTHKLTNVVDPTANQDAATKKYVDDSIPNANGAEIKTAYVTLVAGASATVVSVGFDWDTVLITGPSLTGSSGFGSYHNDSWQFASSALTSYLAVRYNRSTNSAGGEITGATSGTFEVQKSGNNCNIKLDTNTFGGPNNLVLSLLFLKNS